MRKRIVYGVIILWFIFLFVFFLAVTGRCETITLEWDKVENVDGYFIFQYQKSETYDYGKPVVTDKYPDGKIPQDVNRLVIELEGIENTDVKYRFVARSFRGTEMSTDSNEVTYVVARTIPPTPTDLAGEYDHNTMVARLSWTQPQETEEWQTIHHWIVYCRVKGVEEWTAIGTVSQDHELKVETALDIAPENTLTVVEFTVVAYRRSGVFSHNSQILEVVVDKRTIPPVENLRINIEIPI